jgi:hypothetical protein
MPLAVSAQSSSVVMVDHGGAAAGQQDFTEARGAGVARPPARA